MRIHRLLLVLASTVLLAQTATPPGPGARRGPAARAGVAVKAALGLSDQQLQQLVQLRRDEQQALQPIRQQMKAKREALQTARQAANPDPTVVGQLIIDTQNLRQQMQPINADYHNRALALLDDAQKAKLQDLEQSRRMQPAVRGAELLNLLLPRQVRRGAANP